MEPSVLGGPIATRSHPLTPLKRVNHAQHQRPTFALVFCWLAIHRGQSAQSELYICWVSPNASAGVTPTVTDTWTMRSIAHASLVWTRISPGVYSSASFFPKDTTRTAFPGCFLLFVTSYYGHSTQTMLQSPRIFTDLGRGDWTVCETVWCVCWSWGIWVWIPGPLFSRTSHPRLSELPVPRRQGFVRWIFWDLVLSKGSINLLVLNRAMAGWLWFTLRLWNPFLSCDWWLNCSSVQFEPLKAPLVWVVLDQMLQVPGEGLPEGQSPILLFPVLVLVFPPRWLVGNHQHLKKKM